MSAVLHDYGVASTATAVKRAHFQRVRGTKTSWKVLLVALAMFVTAFHDGLRAWEDDVHHVLTFWLASHAGFSRSDADVVANGAQSYDESSFLSAVGSVIWAVLSSDSGAAQSVRDKHFASDAPLPSPPQRRVVVPNSRFARRAADIAIRDPDSTPFEFGQALHPLQDSWSHQGVPDVPFQLNSGYGFGHPAARGGWSSHDADATHLYPEDAVATAQATYELMRAYLDSHPRARARPSTDWEKLEPIVREFARAATKTEKDAWAASNVGQALDTVAGLFGTREMHVVNPRVLIASTGPLVGLGAPAELVDAARGFVTAWLKDQNLPAARAYADLEAIRASLSIPGAATTLADASEWFDKILTSQLLLDHALVSRLGHGDPGHQGYAQLPRLTISDGLLLRPPLAVAVGALSFHVQQDPSRHILVLRDEALGHDEVGVEWRARGDAWLITKIVALPM